jgi:hypothetical protein
VIIFFAEQQIFTVYTAEITGKYAFIDADYHQLSFSNRID